MNIQHNDCTERAK